MSNSASRIREFSIVGVQGITFKLAYPLPYNGDTWGVLSFLKGTSYEKFFKIVPQELINQAIFGHSIPLLNKIGRNPTQYYRSMRPLDVMCLSLQDKSCPIADPKSCFLNGKAPLCYQSPLMEQFPDKKDLLYYVTSSWNEERYIIILEEE